MLYLNVQDAELYDIARRNVKELLGRIIRRSASLHKMISNWTELESKFRQSFIEAEIGTVVTDRYWSRSVGCTVESQLKFLGCL